MARFFAWILYFFSLFFSLRASFIRNFPQPTPPNATTRRVYAGADPNARYTPEKPGTAPSADVNSGSPAQHFNYKLTPRGLRDQGKRQVHIAFNNHVPLRIRPHGDDLWTPFFQVPLNTASCSQNRGKVLTWDLQHLSGVATNTPVEGVRSAHNRPA